MKRFLLLACLLGCLTYGACQCSDKPDVPPVDEVKVWQPVSAILA